MKAPVKLDAVLEEVAGHLGGEERLLLAARFERWAGDLRATAAAMGVTSAGDKRPARTRRATACPRNHAPTCWAGRRA